MLIVPEIQTVVLLTPRTGSRTLKNALMKRYPEAFLVYRHMEADGIPAGYDFWRRIGVVRDPLDRLWSLFNYLQHFGEKWNTGRFCPVYVAKMRESVQGVTFSDWIVNNEVVFTDPYSSDPTGSTFHPAYNVNHRLPETRKSQWLYLRPDLGTQIIPYTSLAEVERCLDVDLNSVPRENQTTGGDVDWLSPDALLHMQQFFAWGLRCRLGSLAGSNFLMQTYNGYKVIRRIYPHEVNAGMLLSGRTTESYVAEEQAKRPDKNVFAVFEYDPPNMAIVYEGVEPANVNDTPEKIETQVRDAKKWLVLCGLAALALLTYRCGAETEPLPAGVEYVTESPNGCVYETRRIGGELWVVPRRNDAEAAGLCVGPMLKP